MLTGKKHYIAVGAATVAVLILLCGVFLSEGQAASVQSRVLRFQEPAYHLAFYNTHTQETLEIKYRKHDGYSPRVIEAVNTIMRDHRSGHTHEIDGKLLDLLHDLKVQLQIRHPDVDVVYHIISGYRSKESNEMMRKAGGGQGKNSQHIEGKAIDIRVPGIVSTEIRNLAWCLQRGGVGFYQGSNFVHVDTGPVRNWNWKPNASTCAKAPASS